MCDSGRDTVMLTNADVAIEIKQEPLSAISAQYIIVITDFVGADDFTTAMTSIVITTLKTIKMTNVIMIVIDIIVITIFIDITITIIIIIISIIIIIILSVIIVMMMMTMTMISHDKVPVVDGDFVPRDPYQLMSDVAYLDRVGVTERDVIVGVNNEEGAMFLNADNGLAQVGFRSELFFLGGGGGGG